MSIVTFWSNGREETGKTMAAVAIATHMAIEHNVKILLISTTNKNETIQNCFWEKQKKKSTFGLFGLSTSDIEMQTGMDGLIKMARSNKISPDTIKNYTKVVFKDTLEVLFSENSVEDLSNYYPEVITMASQYYDFVFVDLDSNINENIERLILEKSDLIIANISQKLSSIETFKNIKQTNKLLASPKTIVMVGRYDKFSKYTAKNISRYLGQRDLVLTMPYNTLYFEAAEEAGVPDLFLRIRKINREDRNWTFMQEAIFVVYYYIKKKKEEKVEETINVDDKTYTLDKMKEFVKKRLDEITKVNLYDIGLSEEELKRRKNKKYELKKALKGCTYGDVNDKKYVKELIFDLLAKEYGVTETNISKAIPFDIPSLLTAQDKFDILIYAYKKEFGYEALTEMIKKYDLAELKFLEGETKPSYVITEDEISEIYEKENISLSFADKLAVVVQRIYQHYKGYSSIDEVRDMNIDGVSGRSIWTSRELFKSGCTN